MLTISSVRASPGAIGQPPKRFPLGGPWKRVFDVTISGIALIVSTPILLASAALIRLLLGKPIIVAEERIGYKGRRFNCYAFRTHHNRVSTAWWVSTKRIARYLGEALRASGLDKLPRLVNVVRGEMSLIGPRPVAASELTRYRVQLPEYFFARPGVIEIWRYVDRRRLDTRRACLAIDRYYVRYWSMRLDLALLIKAIFDCSRRDVGSENDR
jgi:exopolysaccharide production protein ExoY